ncbi:hypothetical protein PCCS19_01830 [Paenibacillus sp. CCS19]|uniref:hypothetical protein n=1 Tax=Paenibacillus sp. CCS19 TaxID=3158387 RepID=UPI002561247C|nr:hypothetical protein [Paenibacillus cellulosilyticus]GMK37130.1 hypothetical protein PCCS19_01830 [Paenibacillus cellulosilyticus]
MQTEQGHQFQGAPNHNPNLNHYKPNVSEVVSVKEWLITNLIMLIPIVNIVMMFVWAFSSNTNPSKANYFKASLLFAAFILALYIVIFIIVIGVFAASTS